MEDGKVQEGRSLDAGGAPPGGPAPAHEAGHRRRSDDARLDVRMDDPGGGGRLPAAHTELVAQPGDWLWLDGDADGQRSSILLDPETGHYTTLGIRRRLEELVALSQRNDEALTCVVFGVDPVPDGTHVTTEAVLEAAMEFASALRQRTRRTDVVGHVEPLTFVVLAPRTAPFGGLRLAERFTSLSLSRYTAGESPVTFGAGVAGVEGYEETLEVRPDLLVAAAKQALMDARTAGAAQIAATWLGV